MNAYILDPSSHVFSDAAPAISCTLLVWLTKVLNVLDVIGPASKYVGYSLQPYRLTRYASVHYSAALCALQKEQDPGWGSTSAGHDTLHCQRRQPSVSYIAVLFLMRTAAERGIPSRPHQPPQTAELQSNQHVQHTSQHWVGRFLLVTLSILCITLTYQYGRR